MMKSEWMKIILYLEHNTKCNNWEKLNEEEIKNLYKQFLKEQRINGTDKLLSH